MTTLPLALQLVAVILGHDGELARSWREAWTEIAKGDGPSEHPDLPWEDPLPWTGEGCAPGQYQKAGKLECANCPPGKYGDQGGLKACKSCDPGRSQSGWGERHCLRCPLGRYQPFLNLHELRAQCTSCPPGRASSPDRKFCKLQHTWSYMVAPHKCKAGTFWSKPKSEHDIPCAACPNGKFNPHPGQRRCQACATGKMSARDGVGCETPRRVPAKVQCPPGHYGSPTTLATIYLECDLCPQGKYQPNAGADKCWACPKGTSANDARKNCHKVWHTLSSFYADQKLAAELAKARAVEEHEAERQRRRAAAEAAGNLKP